MTLHELRSRIDDLIRDGVALTAPVLVADTDWGPVPLATLDVAPVVRTAPERSYWGDTHYTILDDEEGSLSGVDPRDEVVDAVLLDW